MSTESSVAIRPQTDVAVSDLSQWDVGTQTLGQDVLLSKILPMQGMSQLVTDGKATVGEFRDSVTGEKLGSIIEPIEVIPFHVEKLWDVLKEVSENGQKRFVYSRSEPLIEDPRHKEYNDNLPWDGAEDGTPIKRIRRMNYYVLFPKEVENGNSLPFIMSFKSTSFREGKKLFTQMYVRNARAAMPPPAYTFKIGGIKAKNQAGQMYIVPTVELGRKSTPKEIAECLEWYKTIKGKKPGVTVTIDDSDLSTGEAATSQDTGEF